MQRLLFNISGVLVQVETEWTQLSEVLLKSFWSFSCEAGEFKKVSDVSIEIHQTSNYPAYPQSVATMQTQNALTYDEGSIRYCDYYGSAAVKINFKTNHAQVYGIDFDKIHEIVYLLILSRAGKILDLKGKHKLHAFSISFKDIAFVCMMPSKGGKSTLLLELLRDDRVKMISDDIPLVDSKGKIHPFPLKIGLNESPRDFLVSSPEDNIYEMKRVQHGTKVLISTRGLAGRIESPQSAFSNIVLAEAFRFNQQTSQIHTSSWVNTFKGLFKHGVIGIGSPIVIEFFWETGAKDFIVKTWIFFSRLLAFGNLCSRAHRISIYSGRNPEQTASAILDYLEQISTELK